VLVLPDSDNAEINSSPEASECPHRICHWRQVRNRLCLGAVMNANDRGAGRPSRSRRSHRRTARAGEYSDARGDGKSRHRPTLLAWDVFREAVAVSVSRRIQGEFLRGPHLRVTEGHGEDAPGPPLTAGHGQPEETDTDAEIGDRHMEVLLAYPVQRLIGQHGEGDLAASGFVACSCVGRQYSEGAGWNGVGRVRPPISLLPSVGRIAICPSLYLRTQKKVDRAG